ncbi:hypothetical protein DSM112329_02331 [Paraconexibacter sp. AEG42_29]|uniref:Uncharacterized protein n=1 Tax=Paraconexibacter sp. AEG42_29 TaxID=2997339 RepID=A0AAU7AUW5_9ACTN
MESSSKSDAPPRASANGPAEQLTVASSLRPPGVPTSGLRKEKVVAQEEDKRPFPGTSEDLSSAFFISAMLICLIIAIFYFLPST